MIYEVSQMQDICEARNPCKNGGICIQLDAPNDFICSCIGNYTGDTCEGI